MLIFHNNLVVPIKMIHVLLLLKVNLYHFDRTPTIFFRIVILKDYNFHLINLREIVSQV